MRTLDRNTDGKLTHEEIHPSGGPGGHGSAGPGGRPSQGGTVGPECPPKPERFLEQAMTFDANKDGVLNRQELAKMAAAVVEEMRSHRPGGGGQSGGGRPGQDGNGGQRPPVE